jgi:hypothetical protein
MHAACAALFDVIILIVFDKKYKLLLSLRSFLQPSSISPLFGSNIPLSKPFSNKLNLCSSLNMEGHVSQPHKATRSSVFKKVMFVTIVRFSNENFHCLTTNLPALLKPITLRSTYNKDKTPLK